MQSVNVLGAIINIIENQYSSDLSKDDSSHIKLDASEALETYIKDAFCNSFNESYSSKVAIYSKYFSWHSNSSCCPPTAILKNADAIDVKRVANKKDRVSLHNLYPRDNLYADDLMITSDCKECEDWSKKDLLYVVGEVDTQVNSLWFVYGDCYFANRQFYQSALDITDPLNITTFDFAKNNFILNNSCTALHPSSLIANTDFSYKNNNFINVVMSVDKYESCPLTTRKSLEAYAGRGVTIDNFQIPSPNNSSKLMNAKLISYQPLQ